MTSANNSKDVTDYMGTAIPPHCDRCWQTLGNSVLWMRSARICRDCYEREALIIRRIRGAR